MRRRLMMMAPLAALTWTATPSESVTLDFGGGLGRPRVAVPAAGDIDGREPLADNAVFRLAPGDLVTIELDGANTFRAKTIHMAAEAVKIERIHHQILFFSWDEEKHHPFEKSRAPSKELTVGQNVQVRLWVKYLDGTNGPSITLPKSGRTSLRLRRPGDVFVELNYKAEDVAWEDRNTLTADEQAEVQTWHDELRRDYDEVHPRGATVSKGNLGELRVKLTAERPNANRP